ncbi:16294_t:CDS:2, partial [Gigaspora margarita]
MQNNVSNTWKSIYINHDDDEYSSENNSNISSNKMFEQNTMDKEEAEDIIDKLNKFKQKKKPKGPLTYQRKCLESKKIAVGSACITDFFDMYNNLNWENKSSEESSLNNKYSQILESKESYLDDDLVSISCWISAPVTKWKKKKESSKTIALIHGKVIIALGANKDGYWNRAIGIWAFDNSTTHMAMVPDALNVKKMNIYPSECQPKMRSTKWNGHDQKMVYPLDHPKKKLRDQAK